MATCQVLIKKGGGFDKKGGSFDKKTRIYPLWSIKSGGDFCKTGVTRELGKLGKLWKIGNGWDINVVRKRGVGI